MSARRVDAVAFGDLTRAVVVGISAYQDPGLRPLPACARESRRLADALVNIAGCRIPGANVRCLVDGEATRDAVLGALASLSAGAGSEELLLFYFAGHGQAIGDAFALLLGQTRLDQPAASGLTSADLDRIFRDCKARGVLLILDCCGGAALAEHAPDFVRTVGPHEFRILLSASRADQSSWETPKGSLFTGHLLEVVEGRVQVSAAPGQVYFNDLLSHLRHAVGEEIAKAGGRLPQQEPVFNGSYTEDPLIFLHTGETLKSVRVKVQRYSRAYVLQRVRLAVLAIVLLVGLSLAAFWLLLDQHAYLELSDRDVAVFRGYPGLTGFGYPKLWWRMEIEQNQVREGSPLQAGEKVVFSRRQSAVAVLDGELTPSGRALWRLWDSRRSEAGAIVRQALASLSADRPVERSQLLQLFAETATADDREHLMQLAADPKSRDRAGGAPRPCQDRPSGGLASPRRTGLRR
jgi:hypothetical protein